MKPAYAIELSMISDLDKTRLKVTEEEYKIWIVKKLYEYGHTPSALALKSVYVFNFEEWDREIRRFDKLRAITEQTRSLYYKAKQVRAMKIKNPNIYEIMEEMGLKYKPE